MIFDNPNFTERQKSIISEIGKEYRNKIDKDKKVYVMGMSLFLIIMTTILIIFAAVEFTSVGYSVILSIMLIVTIGIGISKKKNQLDLLKQGNDYEIGLFYASRSPKIIGNAEKNKRRTKMSSIIVGVVSALMALMIALILVFSKPKNFDDLIKVEGFIDVINYYPTDDKIDIKLTDDNNKYQITSLYTGKMNVDQFLNAAKKGKVIVLHYNNKDLDDDVKNVYLVEVEGTAFLTKQDVLSADGQNKRVGWILVGIFSFVDFLTIPYYFIYRETAYKKNKSKEIYNLDLTDEEIKSIEDPVSEDATLESESIYIKTTYKKWMLNLYIFFAILGVGFIIGAFFVGDPTGFGVLIGFGLFLEFIASLGLFDLHKNYEVLDGNTFIVNRFFKKKVIDVKDIKSIFINNQYTIFMDKYNKRIFMIANMTVGLGDIVDVLEKRGVRVEVNIM